MTIKIDKDEFKANHLWKDSYLYDLYQKAMTPLEWHKELFEYARSLDLEVFSSPFSKEAVDFLEEFNPVAYKIASFEITDYELVKYTASKGKPIIISTGIATICDIEEVVKICRSVGNENIILLKCTSAYPAPLEDANLLTIPDMKTFGVEVGFSDHTLGILAPIVAVSLGAKVVEKHFILDKSINSADKDFSMIPDEFKKMVDAIRDTQKLLGEISYTPKQGNRDYARSLYIIKDIKKGEKFTNENIKAIRPGFGLHPKHLPQIFGKIALQDLKKGDRMKLSYIDGKKNG
jgi:pseudaminic acid synthase